MVSSWLGSMDAHELCGDGDDTIANRVGDLSLRSTTLMGIGSNSSRCGSGYIFSIHGFET